MVKFITTAVFLTAGLALANQPCPTGVEEGQSCNLEDPTSGPYCIIKDSDDVLYCSKLHKKLSKLKARDYDELVAAGNLRSNNPSCTEENKDSDECKPPEFRNTYQWCSIPIEGVIYLEAPPQLRPIVEKCTHVPSGSIDGESSKISNKTVGVNKEVCKLRCPDHRMDPMFVKKDSKEDNRVFQVTCVCQEGPKGPGLCGWKTTGSGTKEFAGGNLMCRPTHFAAKPILAPFNYNHPNDLEILENYAASKNPKKINYLFTRDNFNVKYVTQERYWDNASNKYRSRYVDMDPNQHQYYEPSKGGLIDTGLFKFPTDLIMENDKGKNDNQHNKIQKAINVRAMIKCKSHNDDRIFFILEPFCKNKRHILKKGRPGYCGWRIAEVQPNPTSSFTEDRLGFDPSVKVPKPQKYNGKKMGIKGLKGKKAEGAINLLQLASKSWRCPDFVENRV
jgi:hypothetical protein